MTAKRVRLLAPPLLGALLVLAMVVASQAASPLPPGSVLLNPAIGIGTAYTPGGVPANFQLVSGQTLVSSYSGDFTGTLTSDIYRDPTTGFLAFAYRFTNTTSGTGILPVLATAVIGSANSPWLGANITDAGAAGDGLSTPAVLNPKWSNGNPFALVRDTNADGAAVSIDWRVLNAGTQLNPPNDFSALIWFATTSTAFQRTTVLLTNTAAVGTACAWAPAVPEPASLVLWGLGLGVVGLSVWRRRR